MRKNSTVVKNGNKMFKQPALTIGLDLGDRSSCYCILDEVGNVILERSVPTTANGIRQAFGSAFFPILKLGDNNTRKADKNSSIHSICCIPYHENREFLESVRQVPISLSVLSEARVSKLHTLARCVCALSIQRLEGRRWRLRQMRPYGI